jgi:hypothetical protein
LRPRPKRRCPEGGGLACAARRRALLRSQQLHHCHLSPPWAAPRVPNPPGAAAPPRRASAAAAPTAAGSGARDAAGSAPPACQLAPSTPERPPLARSLRALWRARPRRSPFCGQRGPALGPIILYLLTHILGPRHIHPPPPNSSLRRQSRPGGWGFVPAIGASPRILCTGRRAAPWRRHCGAPCFAVLAAGAARALPCRQGPHAGACALCVCNRNRAVALSRQECAGGGLGRARALASAAHLCTARHVGVPRQRGGTPSHARRRAQGSPFVARGIPGRRARVDLLHSVMGTMVGVAETRPCGGACQQVQPSLAPLHTRPPASCPRPAFFVAPSPRNSSFARSLLRPSTAPIGSRQWGDPLITTLAHARAAPRCCRRALPRLRGGPEPSHSPGRPGMAARALADTAGRPPGGPSRPPAPPGR